MKWGLRQSHLLVLVLKRGHAWKAPSTVLLEVCSDLQPRGRGGRGGGDSAGGHGGERGLDLALAVSPEGMAGWPSRGAGGDSSASSHFCGPRYHSLGLPTHPAFWNHFGEHVGST